MIAFTGLKRAITASTSAASASPGSTTCLELGQDSSNGAMFYFGSGDKIRIVGIDLDQIGADDFIF